MGWGKELSGCKKFKINEKGDRCFFYHSNIGKEIVGIVEVIQEAFLDKTDQSGRFVAVSVKFIKKLSKPITLENIKKKQGIEPFIINKTKTTFCYAN